MLIALGAATAYPTLQLTMLDMFPGRRGAAASLGGFLQLLLNSVLTAAVVPLVGGSVRSLALAAFALVVVGFGFWVWHLGLEHRDAAPPEHPELLEPSDQV